LHRDVIAVWIVVIGVLMGIEFDGEAVLNRLSGATGCGHVVVTIREILPIPGVAEGASASGIILDDDCQTVGGEGTEEARVRARELKLESRGKSCGEGLRRSEPGCAMLILIRRGQAQNASGNDAGQLWRASGQNLASRRRSSAVLAHIARSEAAYRETKSLRGD
jgi:hypothetical protein